ncbi:MAG: hypothetical protein Q8R53_05185 [Nanoarchaeota archaeon]|nr:hypothetical protein [Nanoarchaeota archaeon]
MTEALKYGIEYTLEGGEVTVEGGELTDYFPTGEEILKARAAINYQEAKVNIALALGILAIIYFVARPAWNEFVEKYQAPSMLSSPIENTVEESTE